jgi:hypothetical protein
MPEKPALVKHPSGYMWGAAVRAAARYRIKFSLPCENNFKERLRSGLDVHKVGLYEFAERKSEAQKNIEKLIRVMIDAQFTRDPAAEILEDWTIDHALYHEKLCPGLWPLC